MNIVVVDYGMGNLRSVQKALQAVAPEHDIRVSGTPTDVDSADRVVFPGQGAMPDCMRELRANNLDEAILRAAHTRPFLGLCVGMQMLFEHSEEGDTPGLSLFAGTVVRFRIPPGGHDKVPHMGWNHVRQTSAHPVWHGIADGARFYHVHSYFAQPREPGLTVATTDYAGAFTSAVARDNIFCTQFHPEKSGDTGLRLLANFVAWQPR